VTKVVDGVGSTMDYHREVFWAPILFSLYLSEIPSTLSKQFQYADDIALTYKAASFTECEANLEVDLERLNRYFGRWRLLPNPTKAEAYVFHLSNHQADRVMDTQFAGTGVQHVNHPKYLGVTLDRSLTYNPYNPHLMKTRKKVAARVNLVHKLAGTNWGASAAPVWLNSVHTNKIDVQLNNAFRIISGI
jgi:Reverse transcriptase (RNA-dependent DNA polymerase)